MIAAIPTEIWVALITAASGVVLGIPTFRGMLRASKKEADEQRQQIIADLEARYAESDRRAEEMRDRWLRIESEFDAFRTEHFALRQVVRIMLAELERLDPSSPVLAVALEALGADGQAG